MKTKVQVESCKVQVLQGLRRDGVSTCNLQPATRNLCSAFTLIEIAISLAIIGIALVGIVGTLPLGLNTLRDSRESTVVNQDATVFIEAIRDGVRGADDLTNYVYAIVNTGSTPAGYVNPLLAGEMNFSKTVFPSVPANQWDSILTNGSNIVGLLSTPEFPNYPDTDPSNHIVVCVRSISGPAVEKPPQDNPILQQDSFSYRIYCVNAPVASADPNSAYGRQLDGNLHELRLTFLWPVLPDGNLRLRPFQATFRTLVAGQVAQDSGDTNLYFYQPQSFTRAP